MPFAKFDQDGNQIRHRVVTDCQQAIEDGEEVLVEQHHAKEVNINEIVRRHGIDLIQKTSALQQMVFDDVTGNDFQEAAIIIAKAEQSFNSMPSKLRERFNHNPAEFLDFVQNNDNAQELIDMGLANAPTAPEVVQVQVVNTDPEPSAETPAE